MNIIPTKIHGILDYLVGITLVAIPFVFDFNEYMPQSTLMIGLGLFTIAMSIFTRYEMGVWKKISMTTHLALDSVVAVILITSPWLFGFAHQMYLPHVLLGFTELFVVIISSSKSAATDHVMDKSDVYHQVSKDSINPLEEGFRPRKGRPATH